MSTDSWDQVERFYRRATERAEYAHLAPMLPLMEWLRREPVVQGIEPFTTQTALCLPAVNDREEYKRHPVVTIVTLPSGEFEVVFSEMPGSVLRMKRVLSPEKIREELPRVLKLLRPAI